MLCLIINCIHVFVFDWAPRVDNEICPRINQLLGRILSLKKLMLC
jgi:hypothetical protein